jgi:hypothetical protein
VHRINEAEMNDMETTLPIVASLLRDKAAKEVANEKMRRRVEMQMSEKMDNGVRPNPIFSTSK